MSRHQVTRIVLAMAGCVLLLLSSTAGVADEEKVAGDQRTAAEAGREARMKAEALVSMLEGQRRDLAAHLHEEKAIREISLFPGHRVGVRMGDLNDRQQQAATDLLESIFEKEALDRIQEVFKQGSGRGDYFFARFWDGEKEDPFTWRMEGHHFSVTFFIEDENRIRPGTLLIGGENSVWKPLDQKARAVYASLKSGQREKVMLRDAPRRTGVPPFVDTVGEKGLAWDDMTSAQQKKLSTLFDAFVGLFEEGVLGMWQDRFEGAGGKKTLHVVYAGAPGEEEGEYHCRLRGAADTHIEFDTRDGHVHMLLHFGDTRMHRLKPESEADTRPSE